VSVWVLALIVVDCNIDGASFVLGYFLGVIENKTPSFHGGEFNG
jgi:hypothetical protein